jgi:hypothetical protein
MAEFESFDRPEPAVVQPPAVDPYPAIEPEPVEIEAESTLEPDQAAPEETEQASAEPEDERPPPMGAVLGERVEWQPLDNLANLPAYEGEMVELHMSDGTVLNVTLDDVRGGTIQVTQRVGGGAMTYNVELDMVDQVRVVK